MLFRSQSIAEAATAFGQIFTAWGGRGYVAAAMDALGMDAAHLLQLAVFITGMAAVYRLPQEKPNSSLLLSVNERAIGIGAFAYGITAVMLCWLGLAAMGDTSTFQYFQF